MKINKIKILYWLPEKRYNRVYESMVPDNRVEQIIAGDHDSKLYKDIFKIEYRKSNLKNIIKTYKPHVLVLCDMVFPRVPTGIKLVYINHGIWAHTPNNIGRVKTSEVNYFDLMCGGSMMFKSLFDKYSINLKPKIAINALTQFDVLYEEIKKQEITRQEIIARSESKDAKRIITLFSHGCKNRVSLLSSNPNYYICAVKLAELAEKNNWLLVVKQKNNDVETFLKNSKHDWAKQIRPGYFALKTNKHVKFVTGNIGQYRYFCSDAIICSSRSTIEIEAALARKPLIRIKSEMTEIENSYELGTLDFKSAYIVDGTNDLEKHIEIAVEGDNSLLFQRQEEFTKELGIVFDGEHHTRVLENILALF